MQIRDAADWRERESEIESPESRRTGAHLAKEIREQVEGSAKKGWIVLFSRPRGLNPKGSSASWLERGDHRPLVAKMMHFFNL